MNLLIFLFIDVSTKLTGKLNQCVHIYICKYCSLYELMEYRKQFRVFTFASIYEPIRYRKRSILYMCELFHYVTMHKIIARAFRFTVVLL